MNTSGLSLRELVLPRGPIGSLTIDFGPGVHLIVGPNGVGKTTLLNTIAGTLRPRTGGVFLDDHPMTSRSDAVVLAPNVPPDLPWIRARLLFDFVVSLYPATRVPVDEAEAILRQLNLPDFMDQPLGTLSAGTARKLLLAAALVARPRVLLFDEPTNEVDTASIDAFRAMIAPIAARHVVLVTTHHAGDLMSLSPTVLELGRTPESPVAADRELNG